MKHFLAIIYLLIVCVCGRAQSGDSSALRSDSSRRQAVPDTTHVLPATPRKARLHKVPAPDTVSRERLTADSTQPPAIVEPSHTIMDFYRTLQRHPYFNFFGHSFMPTAKIRNAESKDLLFYVMLGLLWYYGLINVFFGKYLGNLMALFFRVTMRQQQLREQVLQTPLPSLLFNILFVLTGGLYIAFLAHHYQWTGVSNVWLLWVYSMVLLVLIYTGKFITLKTLGWVFGVRTATDTYIFIVFLVNKMIGIFLIPVLLFMSFPYPGTFGVITNLSITFIFVLFLYRFIISYRPVRNEIKVNPFHFFIYLCAFEIAPLLLIYKVLLKLVESSN